MSNSSAPLVYSTTSSNTGFIAQDVSTILSDTITLTDNTYTSNTSTITISNGGTGFAFGGGGAGNYSNYTIASGAGIGTISTSNFTWKNPEEFVDAFPDYDRIEKMCKEYPGLAIAFEKFKTVYNLVKDHYDTPEDQRPKP